MLFADLISGLETLLLGFFEVIVVKREILQEITLDAAQMLALLFWGLLAFITIWGAL
jgi:hypothetical protein